MIYAGRLFQLGDNAVLTATNKHTGKVVWSRKLGRLSASSPAVTSNTVYVTVLDSGRGAPGRVFAINSKNGATRWSRPLPSRARVLPARRPRPRLLRLRKRHRLRARRQQRQRLLDLPRRRRGQGEPHALQGRPVLRRLLGPPAGGLRERRPADLAQRLGRRPARAAAPSTRPAPSFYGRVYLGNTDGRIYAYDASNGRLDWAVQTGSYVYASPAVTNAPGLGPTIYIGSYNGTFYAINARSGQISWQFDARWADLGLGDDHRPRRLLRRSSPITAPTGSASRPAASSSRWRRAPSTPSSATGRTST